MTYNEITDTMRIDFLEENKISLICVKDAYAEWDESDRKYDTVYRFQGWSTDNREDKLPTPREAIDAAMFEYYGKGVKSE